MENTGSNIGSIITKKNGMFVSADNNGNIREAGIGNPITECSFIAAPNSIINNINGTYYTPLSKYISDSIDYSIDYSISYLLTYFITPIHDIIDPKPEMSIDKANIGNENQLTLNIINYNDKISLNIINIKGNIKYSDIKWYIKSITEENNTEEGITEIINKIEKENNNNNLDLPCKLKYTEGYNNEVIYNKQYFDGIILVYAKASINRINGEEAKCSAHVLLKCDTDTEFAKNAIYTFYKKAESNIPKSLSTDNDDSTTTLSDGSSESTPTTPPVIPIMPTLLPNYQYLPYESYLRPNLYKGSIDLYTRSYPYSFDNLKITYNDKLNTIEVYSVINGTYTNIKNGDTIYNNNVTDMIYSYNPNGSDYTYQKTNSDFKNKICISYCSYSRFKPDSESDTNFINRIQIDSTWGSNPNLKNNSYSTYFYIYGNEIKERPANTNGLSITCNYELDYKNETNTYIAYIPSDTGVEKPSTIEFTLNKDFGYNYDDKYYFDPGVREEVTPGGNQLVEYAKKFGWVIYPSINIGFNETTNNNNYFNKPRVYGFENNNEYKGGDFIRTTPNVDSNISSKTNILYYFNYQHDNYGSISKAPIFKDNHNKLGIDIYGLPLPPDGNNNNSYLPLTILFTTDTDNYGDKINSSKIHEALNIYIYRNTPTPTKQDIYI